MAKITFYGGVKEIGGNKILLQTEDGSVLLDFGRRMGEYGKFFSEFLQARSKNAVRDMLRLGILPKIDGIYTPHLVDMTVLFENEEVSRKGSFGGSRWITGKPSMFAPATQSTQRLMAFLFRMLILTTSKTSVFLIHASQFTVPKKQRCWRKR